MKENLINTNISNAFFLNLKGLAETRSQPADAAAVAASLDQNQNDIYTTKRAMHEIERDITQSILAGYLFLQLEFALAFGTVDIQDKQPVETLTKKLRSINWFKRTEKHNSNAYKFIASVKLAMKHYNWGDSFFPGMDRLKPREQRVDWTLGKEFREDLKAFGWAFKQLDDTIQDSMECSGCKAVHFGWNGFLNHPSFFHNTVSAQVGIRKKNHLVL